MCDSAVRTSTGKLGSCSYLNKSGTNRLQRLLVHWLKCRVPRRSFGSEHKAAFAGSLDVLPANLHASGISPAAALPDFFSLFLFYFFPTIETLVLSKVELVSMADTLCKFTERTSKLRLYTCVRPDYQLFILYQWVSCTLVHNTVHGSIDKVSYFTSHFPHNDHVPYSYNITYRPGGARFLLLKER